MSYVEDMTTPMNPKIKTIPLYLGGSSPTLVHGIGRWNHKFMGPDETNLLVKISGYLLVKTTFTCPWGTFAYKALPFGLCNAPTTFQRDILSIFSDLISEGLKVYMDDFIPYGDDFDQALTNLEKVLEQCITARLCLSHEKCHMMMTKGLVLGHYIYADGIRVDIAKIEVILNLPTPHTQTEVRSFLGNSGYYRRFMPKFSKTAAPLHALTRNVEFQWSDKCDVSFARLKKLISTTLVLRGPNWKIPFQISTDASNIAIGVILG
jgi:hypothetical protein